TNLIKPRTMFQLWRISRVETVIGLATFGLTLATAPRLYWGVLVGILMNLSHFLFQRLHPRIIEVGLHADGSLRDRHLWQLAPIAPRVLALRMDAELDFASANALERRVVDELAQRPDIQHLCLFALPINRIDVTGVEAFMRLRALLQSHGGMLHVAGIKLPVHRRLESAGALVHGPNFMTYRTDAEAVAALQAALPSA
ncbi:MAG: SulP family inorganic anion transporter, partial [Proteobacteria bacterium]|nr:SulP family inorganic anion transporter [Pseudomonadota bacterium]